MLRIKPKYLKDGSLAEITIQKMILAWVSVHPYLKKYKGHFLHFANEGKRSSHYANMLKSIGMRKGASDLMIAVPVKLYPGAWMEVKSAGGTITKEQEQFLSDMASVGYYTCVCYSLDEGIRHINHYFDL